MLKRFVCIFVVSVFCLAGCQSARTVSLTHSDKADDVAGLPYALPYTAVRVELIRNPSSRVGATIEQAGKPLAKPDNKDRSDEANDEGEEPHTYETTSSSTSTIAVKTETKSGDTTTTETDTTETKMDNAPPKKGTETLKFPAPNCGKPSYTVRVTPIHIADPYEPRLMLQMGRASLFSNKKFALQTNEAGLLTSNLARSSYGTLQSAANAVSRNGLVVGDPADEEGSDSETSTEDDSSEEAESEESSDGSEDAEAETTSTSDSTQFEVEAANFSQDSLFARNGQVATERNVVQSAICATTENNGVFGIQGMDGSSDCTLTLKEAKFDRPRACFDGVSGKQEAHPKITVTLTAQNWPNASQDRVKLEKQKNSCNPVLEGATESSAGWGAVCYRLFRVQPYTLTIKEEPYTRTNQGRLVVKPDSKETMRSVGLFLTQADTSAVYDLKVVESVLAANGMLAAFVDGQLVGLSIDRPSPIVTTLTVPFELIGAITSLPGIIAEAL